MESSTAYGCISLFGVSANEPKMNRVSVAILAQAIFAQVRRWLKRDAPINYAARLGDTCTPRMGGLIV